MFPLEKIATKGPQDPRWPAFIFFSGLSKLKSVPIEHLAVHFESHVIADANDVAIPLLGSAFCKGRECHPSFFTILFEAQSPQLTYILG